MAGVVLGSIIAVISWSHPDHTRGCSPAVNSSRDLETLSLDVVEVADALVTYDGIACFCSAHTVRESEDCSDLLDRGGDRVPAGSDTPARSLLGFPGFPPHCCLLKPHFTQSIPVGEVDERRVFLSSYCVCGLKLF